MLSRVPKHEKAMTCPVEKCLCLGSFLQALVIVLLAEFNVNESVF